MVITWAARACYSLLDGLLLLPAVPICLLFFSTPLDTMDTMSRGTSCGLCNQAPPSTTKVSPVTNLHSISTQQAALCSVAEQL
jgi:hypothetical protein